MQNKKIIEEVVQSYENCQSTKTLKTITSEPTMKLETIYVNFVAHRNYEEILESTSYPSSIN